MDFEKIGKYLEEQLKKRKGLYEVDTGMYWGLDPSQNFTQRNPDLKVGEREIEIYGKNVFGSSAIYDGMATDIPLVDYSMNKASVKALMFINGAQWSNIDLEVEQTANESGLGITQNMVATSYELMGEFLNRRENETMLFGNEDREIYGVLNQPITPVDYAVSNLYNPAVTPIQIYRLFLSWIQLFVSRSKISNSQQILIKIPERLKARLSEPYSDAMPSVTVFEMLTNPSKGYSVSAISSAIELEGQHLQENGVTITNNRDRIIFKTVSSALECSFMPRKTTPKAAIGAKGWEVFSYSAMSSVYCPRENRLMYVDILNNG